MNKELVVLSAVYGDHDVSAIAQARPELFQSYGDVRDFMVKYYGQYKELPPPRIVEEKFAVTMVGGDLGTTRHHIDELQNLYLSRQLREILRETSIDLQDNKLTVAMNKMAMGSLNLRKQTENWRDLDITDIDSAIKYMEEVQRQKALGNYGVQFGIPGIDDFLPSGVIPGMFGLILGYPGRGKSFLTTLMAVRAWQRGKRVLYISLEMTEPEVRARIYTIVGEGTWSLRDLQRGDINISEFRSWVEDNFSEKEPLPIVSNDGTGRFTPASLRAKIDEYKPDIVFIDYLQLMGSNSANDGNETVRLKQISTELKILATSERVSIVGVVSATPDDATNMDTIPELGQVAWSKQLAYDADWMLAVGRSDNDPLMGVAWRKNRNGPLTDWILDCNFDRGIFRYDELDFGV